MFPAVDVGVAKYSEEGCGLEYGLDMINQDTFGFNSEFEGYSQTSMDIDISKFLDLEGLVDAKVSTPVVHSNWIEDCTPGFEPYEHSDPSVFFNNSTHPSTLSNQPLF